MRWCDRGRPSSSRTASTRPAGEGFRRHRGQRCRRLRGDRTAASLPLDAVTTALREAGFAVCEYDGDRCADLGRHPQRRRTVVPRGGATFVHLELARAVRDDPADARPGREDGGENLGFGAAPPDHQNRGGPNGKPGSVASPVSVANDTDSDTYWGHRGTHERSRTARRIFFLNPPHRDGAVDSSSPLFFFFFFCDEGLIGSRSTGSAPWPVGSRTRC